MDTESSRCARTRRIISAVTRLLIASIVAAVVSAVAAAAAVAAPLAVSVTDTETGQPLAPGFTGLSIEYPALHEYAGRNPSNVNPVFEQLIQGLAPGSAPVLRIGGDTADQTWWPVAGMLRPPGVTYALTKNWVAVARKLAQVTGAQYTFDINLAADNPLLAAVEGRELVAGVGRKYVSALEIGNEPDLYTVFGWYTNHAGKPVKARGGGYSMQSYASQLATWRAVLPSVPLVGPALATESWVPSFSTLKAADPQLAGFTLHDYPLRSCGPLPTDVNYPAIPNLLADSSSAGVAQSLLPAVEAAQALGLPLRLDELNTASCEGMAGVSNSFASALWALDTFFNLAAVGVEGVNIHTLPGSAYAPFSFTLKHGQWSGTVNPIYYGMLMFAQSFPAGARLLSVSAPQGPLKVWATQDTTGRIRVVLINKDPSNASDIALQVPAATGNLSETWLSAPSLTATGGVTLGGEGFAAPTTTGTLPANPSLPQVAPQDGVYDVQVPPSSAVMLTPAS